MRDSVLFRKLIFYVTEYYLYKWRTRMCEEEVDRSVRLYMMSMDLCPSQEGFQMLAKAIVLRIYYGLPRIKIY